MPAALGSSLFSVSLLEPFSDFVLCFPSVQTPLKPGGLGSPGSWCRWNPSSRGCWLLLVPGQGMRPPGPAVPALTPTELRGKPPALPSTASSLPGQSSCSRGDLIAWETNRAEPLIQPSLGLMCSQQQLSQKQSPAQGPGARNQLCGVLCLPLDQPAWKGCSDNPTLTWPSAPHP